MYKTIVLYRKLISKVQAPSLIMQRSDLDVGLSRLVELSATVVKGGQSPAYRGATWVSCPPASPFASSPASSPLPASSCLQLSQHLLLSSPPPLHLTTILRIDQR